MVRALTIWDLSNPKLITNPNYDALGWQFNLST